MQQGKQGRILLGRRGVYESIEQWEETTGDRENRAGDIRQWEGAIWQGMGPKGRRQRVDGSG